MHFKKVSFMYMHFTSVKKSKNWIFIKSLLNTWLANPTQGKSTSSTEPP